MSEKVSKLTEGTLVPVGLVITIIGVVYWASTSIADMRAQVKAIDERQDRQGAFALDVSKKYDVLNERTARMEGKIDTLLKR